MAVKRRRIYQMAARLKGAGRLTATATLISGRALSDAARLTGSVHATGVTPQVMQDTSSEWKAPGWWDEGLSISPAGARIEGALELLGQIEIKQAWAQPGLLQDDV
jgi:hypothetical protein